MRQELKLTQGTRTDLADNIREVTAAAEVHQQESGTSAPGVRRGGAGMAGHAAAINPGESAGVLLVLTQAKVLGCCWH